MTGTIPPLSQTMYEAMACPASYQASHVHGAQSPGNIFSELGTEVHHALAQYIKRLVAVDAEEDWPFFEEIIRTNTEEAQKILRGFIGSMKFNPRTILTTEHRFIYDDAAGTPDLITMESPVDATIWDYKNYFEMIEPTTFQSKLYPLLLFRHNPNLETVRFVLVFVRYGRTKEVVWTRDQVPALEKLLANARERQRAIHETEGLAKAVPGRACEYCPLRSNGKCQVRQWNPHLQMSDEDRVRHAIFLRSALAETNAILRVKARERVISVADENGREYQASFHPTEKRTLPIIPALKVLQTWYEDFGEDLTDKAAISRTSLASLRSAKKRAVLDQALHDIEAVKPTSTFKISKTNPDLPDEEHG